MPPSHADALVIGAGPVGLWQVFQLGLQGLSCHVVDSLPDAGGQTVALYGDKPIYDLPGLPACTGVELTERLIQQIAPFTVHWHLGGTVTGLAREDGGWQATLQDGRVLHARLVFVAAGVGAFAPKKVKAEGIEAFEGRQVHYEPSLPPAAALARQAVVVHGGDATAVDCALRLAEADLAPASVTLLHRRDQFQASDEALARLQALRAAGRVQVVAGQILGIETTADGPGGWRLQALQLLNSEGQPQRLPLDQLLVWLGLSPKLGPMAEWGLAMAKRQLVVDPATFATSAPGIYAVGDVVTYPGKRKLIVCGFHEATLAAWSAAEALAGQAIPLEYTSSSRRLQQRLGVLPD